MSRTRVYVDDDSVVRNNADGKDRKVFVAHDEAGEELHGHEVAVCCAGCGDVAVLLVNPPRAPAGGPSVWVEAQGPVIAWERLKPRDVGSYALVGFLSGPPPAVFPDLPDSRD